MITPIFDSEYTTLVVNCSDEYVPYLDVCFQSVLDSSNKNNLYDLVILTSSISDINKKYIESKYCSENFKIRFFNPASILELDKIADTFSNYSKESFYKIIIPRIFSGYKKLIYSDVDIIFNCDIKEIQDIDIGSCPIGATRDFALTFGVRTNEILKKYLYETVKIKNFFDYFSAGLILYSIENFPENDIKNMLDIAHNSKFWHQEQDLFNNYYNGKIFELPYRYCINTAYMYKFNDEFFENEADLNNYKDALSNPSVIHYSGSDKPWHIITREKDGFYSYDYMWWNKARKTDFYEYFIYSVLKKEMTKIQNENTEKFSNVTYFYGKPLKYVFYKLLWKLSFGKKRKKFKEKFFKIKQKFRKLQGEK